MSITTLKKYAKILSDKEFVQYASLKKENFLTINGSKFYPYETTSMSHGLPGLCFLFNELSQIYPKEETWLIYMNNYLQEIVKSIQNNNLSDISLFSGLSGVGTLITACSQQGKFYSKFKLSIDSYLRDLLKAIIPLITNSTTLQISYYDTIQGLSGVLNYLILNEANIKYFKDEINEILDYFIELSHNDIVADQEVSKWVIPSENLFLDEERNMYPDGALNLGVSHGVAGPLIVMSSALLKGIKRKGLNDAVEYLANVLISTKNNDNDAWPGMVDFKKYLKSRDYNYEYRDAWCYGRPGVAFALLKASMALNNKGYYNSAVMAMKKGIESEKGIISPTFCHGYAGLAYIYYKFYKLTGEKLFYNETYRLLKQIEKYFDTESVFGFQNIEYDENKVKKIDSIGLLDGISGVYLVLFSITADIEGDWEAMFLLN